MALLLAAEFRGQQGDIHILHYRGRLISGSTWPALGATQRRWKSTTGVSKRRRDRRQPAGSRKGSKETVAAKGPPKATDQSSGTAATKEATAAT